MITNSKLITLLFFLAFVSMSSTAVLAANKENKFKVGNYEYTWEQFKSLPEVTRKKLPILDFMSSTLALREIPLYNVTSEDQISTLEQYEALKVRYRRLLVLSIQDRLRVLGYFLELPSESENVSFKDAIKEFQSAIKSSPTGELLVGESEKLDEMLDLFKPRRINLLHVEKRFYYDKNYRGLLSASGAWRREDSSKENGNLNSVEIDCRQSEGECKILSVYLRMFGPSDSDYIVALNNNYVIKKWNDNQVIAADSSPACYINTLYINLKTEKIQLRSKIKNVNGVIPSICKAYQKFDNAMGGSFDLKEEGIFVLDKASSSYPEMDEVILKLREEAMSQKYKNSIKKLKELQ